MMRKKTGILFSEMFPSKWLNANDVEDGVEVTVVGLTEELVGRERQKKHAVQFKEFSKPLLLNLTNARALRDIAGSDDTYDWVGTVVRLTTPLIEYGGKTQPAIRIGFPVAKETAPRSRREKPPAVEQTELEDDPF